MSGVEGKEETLMTLKCCDCPYHYREYDYEQQEFIDKYPCCHFVSMFPDDLAPCEYEDDIPEDDLDEYL